MGLTRVDGHGVRCFNDRAQYRRVSNPGTARTSVRCALAFGLLAATCPPASALAQVPTSAPAYDESSLSSGTAAPQAISQAASSEKHSARSLDELMDTEVTLVSRRPERISQAASAVQVITGEEIQRSGALTLPEALRLASNLQVAQLNAHDWAISARGFNGAPSQNNAFADKLLVMIDGRSVYTPLFGGVFWDVQNVLLEDVDRIEVVSGPGGSLWGANAVNGVINVVTKSARDTQGVYFTQAAGTWWQDYTSVRYGGKIGNDFYYRIYGLGFIHDNTQLPDGVSADDQWRLSQTGFRGDYYPSYDNTFTVQGDFYRGAEGDPATADVAGGNLLGRWTHIFTDRSDFTLQLYYDETWRDLTTPDLADVVRTWDADFQHRFPVGDRNSITWGANYRFIIDKVSSSPQISFDPERRQLQLFSAFIQDEISIVPDALKLTLGSKFEHNDYSGWEFQPSARLAWMLNDRQTIWAAVSRAVRSPARFDQDEVTPFFSTPQDFDSEKVTAYEVGYRVRPIDALSLSVATFFNHYDDLRSVDFVPGGTPGLRLANNQAADSYGVELSGDLQLADWWRLRGGYTYFERNIYEVDPLVVPGSETFESNDPRNQVVLQSMTDLPYHLQFDLLGRYVDALPQPAVPSYFSLDARLAWHYRDVEVSVVGQNLLDTRHPEFGAQEIPRGVYGQVSLRW